MGEGGERREATAKALTGEDACPPNGIGQRRTATTVATRSASGVESVYAEVNDSGGWRAARVADKGFAQEVAAQEAADVSPEGDAALDADGAERREKLEDEPDADEQYCGEVHDGEDDKYGHQRADRRVSEQDDISAHDTGYCATGTDHRGVGEETDEGVEEGRQYAAE